MEIGNSAFEGCAGLKSLTIPQSVTAVGDYAFQGCSGLRSITFESPRPPEAGTRAFQGVDNACCLRVPLISVSEYRFLGRVWGKDFNCVRGGGGSWLYTLTALVFIAFAVIFRIIIIRSQRR